MRERDVPAIVLCLTGTGMATVRALAQADIDVHAFIFRRQEPIHRSRYARKVFVPQLADGDALIDYLIAYCDTLPHRPVVFPTCDTYALLLAKHRERLLAHCVIWNNHYDDLSSIINKNELYSAASALDVPTVPSISDASAAEIATWSAQHPAPYLLKPPFEGAASWRRPCKNVRLDTRPALLEYVERNDSRDVIVQRLIRGGDGYVFDCYGLCDRNGRVVTMASHRRWRQHLPDFGATSFGEIPSGLPPDREEQLFAHTAKLFAGVRYHGIFGIEWLQDRATDQLYMIDFNARPFSSIGHLYDCGVNLPLLSYRELLGQTLVEVPVRSKVKHKYWIDFDRDQQTFRDKRAHGELSTWAWLRSLARCRSFAYFDWRDPGPCLSSLRNVIKRACVFGFNRLMHRKPSAANPHDELHPLIKRA